MVDGCCQAGRISISGVTVHGMYVIQSALSAGGGGARINHRRLTVCLSASQNTSPCWSSLPIYVQYNTIPTVRDIYPQTFASWMERTNSRITRRKTGGSRLTAHRTHRRRAEKKFPSSIIHHLHHLTVKEIAQDEVPTLLIHRVSYGAIFGAICLFFPAIWVGKCWH